MRILVAMSGGVDSSVTAAILKEQGHDVIGATLQLYDHRGPVKKGSCCAGKDIRDARAVADKLGFPHYVIDAEDRFKKTVIDEFANAYARGETPVPCAACNQGVKFTDLLNLARDLGCDGMATGHYVKKVDNNGQYELHRPDDHERDQSWFLYVITQEQLSFLHFPLGGFPNKDAVRQLAEKFSLNIASKPDSQDICFVTNGSYAEIVEKLRPEVKGKGEIVDEQGNILGEHEGIVHYTVGQSKRLGDLHTKLKKRQVVKRIDSTKKRIIIGPRDTLQTSDLKKIYLNHVNWLCSIKEKESILCQVQVRARAKPIGARVYACADEQAEVFLEESTLAAPGQACVFYDGSRILGGGIIQSSSGL